MNKTKKILRISALIVLLLALFPISLWSQNINWTGAVDSDWETAGNWNPNTVPAPGDNVQIDPTRRVPRIDVDRTVANLIMVGTGIVSINANLRVTGSLSQNSSTVSLTVESGGSLNVTGDSTIRGGLNSNGGSITLAGNVMLNGLNISTAGDISLGSDSTNNLTINGNVTINAVSGSNPNITIHSNVVHSGTPGGWDLTITMATAETAGSGSTITTGSIGTASNYFNSIQFTAERIILRGSVFSDSEQQYTTSETSGNDGGTFLQFDSAGTISTRNSGTLTFDDLYIDTDMAANTITIESISNNRINSDRFTFYRGTLNFSGLTLRTSDDFVILGSGYRVDDTERGSAGVDVNEWEYTDFSSLQNNPGAGTYSAQFLNLQGSSIEVTGNTSNFYVNGTDLNPSSEWTLTLPANTSENPSYTPVSGTEANKWGIPYAIVLNSTIANSTVGSRTIIAANTVTIRPGVVSVTDDGNNTTLAYNSIDQPSSTNSYRSISQANLIRSYGYDFARTSIESAATVKTDLIRIRFNKPVLNSSNEICTNTSSVTAGNSRQGGETVNFDADGSWLDGDTRAVNQTRSTGCNPEPSTYYALRTFYLKLPSTASWRSDSTGSGATGEVLNSGLGGTNSTDSLGRRESVNDPTTAYGNIIPDIVFEKGLFRGSNGADLAIAGANNLFSQTTDETGPILYEIRVGRANQTDPNVDSHNYFRLMYSEPVAFGDVDGARTSDSQIGLRYDNSGTLIPADSDQSFAENGHGGGEIRDVSGTIQVTGLFTYTNSRYASNPDYRMLKGRRNSSVSDSDIDMLRKPTLESLEVYLAARRVGSNWIGWVFNVLDPYAAEDNSIRVLANRGITDRAGNVIDEIQSTAVIQGNDNSVSTPVGTSLTTDFTPDSDVSIDFWDVSSPGISSSMARTSIHPTFNTDRTISALSYEIVPIDANSNQLIDALNFFIHDNVFNRSWDFAQGEDNTQMLGNWDSLGSLSSAPSHQSMRRIRNTRGMLVTPPRGIRDNSIELSDPSGFRIGVRGQLINEAVDISTISARFSTETQTELFNPTAPNIINTVNDSYFSISFNDTVNNWDITDQIFVTYDSSIGRATDLAGNLMPSSGLSSIFTNNPHPDRFSQNPYTDSMGENGKLLGIELSPPQIVLILAAVGGQRIYIRFDEPVFGSEDLNVPLSASDFTFSNANITSAEIITSHSGIGVVPGISELYLILDTILTPEMILEGTIRESYPEAIWDSSRNGLEISENRRISDVLLGVINPVWASDGIQVDETRGRGFTALRDFSGNGSLSDFDITIESSIQTRESRFLSLPLNLYFDVDVPESQMVGDGFWSVIELSGLINRANNSARQAQLLSRNNNIYQHSIPSGDAEISNGREVEFMYLLGDRLVARASDPNQPESIDTWSFNIDGIVEQRNSATILNNVINPSAGDQTILDYSVERSGIVVINVFTTDGDLVRVLNRSRLANGRYTQVWDGRNNSGEIVAPGFYFVRLLGPNMDEVRKVLVVR